MKEYLFLILILVLAAGPPIFSKMTESFKNKNKNEGFTLGGASGEYPCAQNNVLLQDTYPITGSNSVSDETGSKMWWRYPTFEVGSFKQMTNNIRYPNNPDDARCTPADVCYALYKNKNMGSNIVTPLPPVETNSGTRIGYFVTNDNLMPFRTDVPNILY